MIIKKSNISSVPAAYYRFKNNARVYYYHLRRRLSSLLREAIKEFRAGKAVRRSPAGQQESISFEYLCRTELELFLASGARLAFKSCPEPAVSIVLVLYNRAELTYTCLVSLHTISKPCELIIVDNASSDDTGRLLAAVDGARIVRNSENIHFVNAVNQAAALAAGTYLLLLNNDAQVLPGAVDSALELIAADSSVGAVGAKVVRFDGTLQEASSIIWRDGSCQGYGRGANPLDSDYMFQRDVDYCSGVFLLTPRKLFIESGCFDPAFAPAYYEETDYCMRLRAMGRRIVYNPGSVVLHVEFASSSSPEKAIELQKAHREVFRSKHAAALANHYERGGTTVLKARSPRSSAMRVLHIDDRVPHSFLGSGYPRSRDLLSALDALSCLTTFYPLQTLSETWDEVYCDIPRTIEVVADGCFERLEAFLSARVGFFTTIIISRPHNMWSLKKILRRRPEILAGARLIYDAEAVFCLRDMEKNAVQKRRVCQTERSVVLEEELNLALSAYGVVTVSKAEQQLYQDAGFNNVHILGHTVPLTMTTQTFKERRDFLFVGAFSGIESPNADSVIWFVEHVLPRIKAQIAEPFKFIIAGNNSLKYLHNLQSSCVDVKGGVDNLSELYNACRVFVVPTRYAAGIPYKAHHAAAHGLPLAVTRLIGGQLGWVHEQDVLIGDGADDFAAQCVRLYRDEALWTKVRNSAAERIKNECSHEAFIENVRTLLE